jgi:hypothetical protein
MRRVLLLLALIPTTLQIGCPSTADANISTTHQAETSDPDGTSFEERLLLTLPEGMDIREAVVSANGRSTAYPAKTSSGTCVVINGRNSDFYDKVWDLHISRDGKTVAFLAFQNGKGFVVVNGRKGELFPSVQSLQLSPDGATVLYVARTGRRAYQVVVGDHKGEEFEEVDDITLSPDGKTFAYRAALGGKKWIVVGDRKGEEFSYVGPPQFSPDGKLVAYEAALGENKDRKFIVLGDKRLREWDYVTGPSFTPDGKVVYAANRRDKSRENVQGRPESEWEELLRRLKPPQDGKWIISVGEEQRDLAAGVETLLIGPFAAPDGRIVYTAKKGDRECVVRGDHSDPPFPSVGHIGFGPDGTSMIYVARLSKDPTKPDCHVVIDGKAGEQAFGYIENFAVSPDGKKVALKVHAESGTQVVVGQQRSEAYPYIYDFNFSRDGKKLAFCARRGREIWWKVMKVE